MKKYIQAVLITLLAILPLSAGDNWNLESPEKALEEVKDCVKQTGDTWFITTLFEDSDPAHSTAKLFLELCEDLSQVAEDYIDSDNPALIELRKNIGRINQLKSMHLGKQVDSHSNMVMTVTGIKKEMKIYNHSRI